MNSYVVRLDLLKLAGASLVDLKGKSGAVQRCVVLPVESARLFVGEKGVYLEMSAFGVENSRYGDTHMLKQRVARSVLETMDEEERRMLPILGNMRPMRPAGAGPQGGDGEFEMAECGDDLPF